MQSEVVRTLDQLVRIPSVNPMGGDAPGEQFYEHALTDHLEGLFRSAHLAWERHRVAPQRENIVARLDGDRRLADGGRLLAFEVHQDTVPVDGMTIDPWKPVIRHGRLYGRGACDIKGGMACMLTAFLRLAAERPPQMPTIVLVCTVNEENGFTGSRELARYWRSGQSPLVPRLPDAMVVAEPTSLDIVVAHKGVVRWKCHTVGRAAHSSCPDDGINAIYQMAHVVVALDDYARRLAQSAHHPLVGAPSLNVGTIHGGLCVNAVPDQCTIEIDRRLLPDEEPAGARQDVIDWLAAQTPPATQLRHDPAYLESEGLVDQSETELARRLREILHRQGLPGRQIGVPYGTDAPSFAADGIPTVVFGPGSIAQAHTSDEWVSIEELHAATEVYYALGRQAPGGQLPAADS